MHSRRSNRKSSSFGDVRLKLLLILAIVSPLLLISAVPDWWSTPGVFKPGAAADDYAVINQGQLKNLAAAAVAEMNQKLPLGAGSDLNNLVDGWSDLAVARDDYAAVNLGQLKSLAGKFYDRLGQSYPWSSSTNAANDYALANIGQAKTLFSFNIIPSVFDNIVADPMWQTLQDILTGTFSGYLTAADYTLLQNLLQSMNSPAFITALADALAQPNPPPAAQVIDPVFTQAQTTTGQQRTQQANPDYDSDGDLVPDAHDAVPYDPAFKFQPIAVPQYAVLDLEGEKFATPVLLGGGGQVVSQTSTSASAPPTLHYWPSSTGGILDITNKNPVLDPNGQPYWTQYTAILPDGQVVGFGYYRASTTTQPRARQFAYNALTEDFRWLKDPPAWAGGGLNIDFSFWTANVVLGPGDSVYSTPRYVKNLGGTNNYAWRQALVKTPVDGGDSVLVREWPDEVPTLPVDGPATLDDMRSLGPGHYYSGWIETAGRTGVVYAVENVTRQLYAYADLVEFGNPNNPYDLFWRLGSGPDESDVITYSLYKGAGVGVEIATVDAKTVYGTGGGIARSFRSVSDDDPPWITEYQRHTTTNATSVNIRLPDDAASWQTPQPIYGANANYAASPKQPLKGIAGIDLQHRVRASGPVGSVQKSGMWVNGALVEFRDMLGEATWMRYTDWAIGSPNGSGLITASATKILENDGTTIPVANRQQHVLVLAPVEFIDMQGDVITQLPAIDRSFFDSLVNEVGDPEYDSSVMEPASGNGPPDWDPVPAPAYSPPTIPDKYKFKLRLASSLSIDHVNFIGLDAQDQEMENAEVEMEGSGGYLISKQAICAVEGGIVGDNIKSQFPNCIFIDPPHFKIKAPLPTGQGAIFTIVDKSTTMVFAAIRWGKGGSWSSLTDAYRSFKDVYGNDYGIVQPEPAANARAFDHDHQIDLFAIVRLYDADKKKLRYFCGAQDKPSQITVHEGYPRAVERTVELEPLESAPQPLNQRVEWSRVNPNITSALENHWSAATEDGKWEDLEYAEEAVEGGSGQWKISVGGDAKKGVSRYKVAYGSAESPGANFRHNTKMDHRISDVLMRIVIKGNYPSDYLRWASTYINVPFVDGSHPKQVDNYIAVDCADTVLKSWILAGHAVPDFQNKTAQSIVDLAQTGTYTMVLPPTAVYPETDTSPAHKKWSQVNRPQPGDVIVWDWPEMHGATFDHATIYVAPSGPGVTFAANGSDQTIYAGSVSFNFRVRHATYRGLWDKIQSSIQDTGAPVRISIIRLQ